jgi:hypothetical protein
MPASMLEYAIMQRGLLWIFLRNSKQKIPELLQEGYLKPKET